MGLPGGSFFIAAAVYVAVTKPPDIVTMLTIIACTLCAALATTKRYPWSIVTGAIMIAGSLSMQFALSYTCSICLKADALILCGIIYLAALDNSRLRLVNRGLAGCIALVLLAFFTLSTPIVQATDPNTVDAGRYIQASDVNGQSFRLDTAQKPVVLFNPECGACGDVVMKLAQMDPLGERWTPAQSGGRLEDGSAYLVGKGYVGAHYVTNWPGTVPAMIVTRGEKTLLIRSHEQMVRIIGGDTP